MKIFYFALFAAVGIFNILAALLDWKWYIDYWSFQRGRPKPTLKSRNFLRFMIGSFGAVLVGFGIAVLVGWI